MKIIACLLAFVAGSAFLIGEGDAFRQGDVVRYRADVWHVDKGEMTVSHRMRHHVTECYLVVVEDPNFPPFLVSVNEIELVP